LARLGLSGLEWGRDNAFLILRVTEMRAFPQLITSIFRRLRRSRTRKVF
jgi:hypothetical protein